MSSEIINGLFALGGALVGAIATVLLTRHFQNKAEKRKEITIEVSRPSLLIGVSSEIRSDVTIQVRGQNVEKVYRSEVGIVNSGTQVVRDVRVSLDVSGPGTLVAADVASASFAYSTADVEVQSVSDRKAEVSSEYLNPGDELVVSLLHSERPEDVVAYFRQPDTKCIVRREKDPKVAGVFAEAFFSALSSSLILDAMTRVAIPEYRRYLRAKASRRESRESLD